MDRFRLLGREMPQLGRRTLDLLHVACALEIGASAFLTFDKRQASLAKRAGLATPACA